MRQINHCIRHFEKDSLVSFFGFVPWGMSQNPISVILGKIKTPLAKIMWSDDSVMVFYSPCFQFVPKDNLSNRSCSIGMSGGMSGIQ
jgi:hypothetical protein